MVYRNKLLFKFLEFWPGKRTLGIYRFLPIFFVLGASLEFSMINWEAGQSKTNFYKTYKRKLAEEIIKNEELGIPTEYSKVREPLDDLEEYVKKLKEHHQHNIEQNTISQDLANINEKNKDVP